MKKDYHFFRKLYAEILRGYSVVNLSDKIFYLKHSNEVVLSKSDSSYEFYYDYSLSRGASPEKEKIQFLIENDLWQKSKEDEIARLQEEIERQELTLSKVIVKAQKNIIKNKIERAKESLDEILAERNELVGETCESYASKKSNEDLLKHVFFKDESLTERLYSDEEYEEVEYAEITTLYILMTKALENFTHENLKVISLMPFFLNSFFISGDAPFFFYGKPTIELSNYQLDLFSLGITVKNGLSEKNPIPQNLTKDPMLALSWFNMKDIGSQKDLDNKHGISVVGASIDEMKALDPNADSLEGRKKKMFGDKETLNMQDMLKLHGY